MTEKPKISRVEVYWHTVEYRTMVLYVIVLAAIVLTAAYIVFPECPPVSCDRMSDTLRDATIAELRHHPPGRPVS